MYILFNGRFPGDKAAALFAAESARSFAAHLPVTLLVPRRLGRGRSAHEAYGLPASVAVVYLPTIDLFGTPLRKIGFWISYIVFSLAGFVYLLWHARAGDIIDTNEPLPALLATFVSRTVLIEVHDYPEHFQSMHRWLYRRAKLVLATNTWKRAALIKEFGLPENKVLMERNGVDVAQFAPQDRAAARKTLGLSDDATIAIYTGHLYGWKGVDTFAKAASLVPEVQIYLVGGTQDMVAHYKTHFSNAPNLHVVGQRPHQEVPHWLAAADVLVLPNTAKEEISAHYTSPMKLFEYMGSQRPIVASAVPSITEVLSPDEAFLAKPDSPDAFAAEIRSALTDPTRAAAKATRSRASVLTHSWEARAKRILDALTK